MYGIKFKPENNVVTLCDQPLGGGTQLEVLGDTVKLFDQDLNPTKFGSYKIIDSKLSKEELIKKFSKPVKITELKWGKQVNGVLHQVEKA